MRIISQDGTYSFNYDNHDLRLDDEYIYCVTDKRDVVIGKYNTSSDAEKVFERITQMLLTPNVVSCRLPQEEGVDKWL